MAFGGTTGCTGWLKLEKVTARVPALPVHRDPQDVGGPPGSDIDTCTGFPLGRVPAMTVAGVPCTDPCPGEREHRGLEVRAICFRKPVEFKNVLTDFPSGRWRSAHPLAREALGSRLPTPLGPEVLVPMR